MLTVVVITKNEENLIQACLESVSWADEIIVCDNGSTDRTIAIAKKYTDKIFKFEDLDFATIRNKGMEKAFGDWVLYLDADERILSDLRNEISELTKNDKCSAFAISRRNIIFGSEQSYGPFWPDWMIKLIKRSDFETWVGKVHEYAKFKGKLGYTKNSLLHLTHRDVDQIVNKSLAFSKIEARLRLDANHPKMTGWRFLRIFIVELFYQAVVRKGFFAGSVGIMDSILQTFSMYLTYVRLWQLQQPQPLDKTYEDIDKDLIKNNFKY